MVLSIYAHAAVTIDGDDTESEWGSAQALPAMVLTQPDSGAAPNFPTQVRYVSTPEGVAFFFRNDQDAALYPTRAQRASRDNVNGSDRVNVMLDFDGNGQAGYSFTLSRSNSIEDGTISNENIFNQDWDGFWLHAVREREGGWNAEILIPWSSALMRTSAGERTIGVYVDRVIGSSETRSAFPKASFFKPQFLSLFSPRQIASYTQGLLRFYPFGTVTNNFRTQQLEYRAGVDISWKPSPNFQLTSAINPDFGQVEADNLVVNFDAVETFFSDKRPFFTENQSAFVRLSPEEEQLVYTRRVGGPRDDGNGVSDIDAAVKMSGSAMGLDYGVFAVRERDPDKFGHSVGALRLKKTGASIDVGYLGSYVESPFLNRFAAVHALDAEVNFGHTQWTTTVLASDIRQSGTANTGRNTRGTGGFSTVRYKPNDGFVFRGDLTRYGQNLDFNDLGYQRRADYALYETSARWFQNSYGPNSALRSSSVAFDIDLGETSAGRNLFENYSLKTDMSFRDGAGSYFEIGHSTDFLDDLVSRGNGTLAAAGGPSFFGNYNAARQGAWQHGVALYKAG
jgi:hypothetical protein